MTPREVETALEACDGVREAYVVGLPDPARGQVVAAAVVLEAGATAEEDRLRADLKATLSAYKVPRRFGFYAHEALPFTDSGKIDKRALAALMVADR